MKKRIIWISVAVVVLIAAVVACWWFLSGKDGGDGEETQTEESSQKETASPAELMKMPALEGDTELSEERQELINQSILEQIDLRVYGRPSVNKDGNYVALENGELYRKETESVDYANYNANISVLINAFADRGYSETAINQIQRMYFHYWRAYSVYSTGELVEKLAQCFPAGGTNSTSLTKKACEVFGHVRDDGFGFVFTDEEIATITPLCAEVDPYFLNSLDENQKELLLFTSLHFSGGNEYERNLEKWLSKIVYELSEAGMSKRQIYEAQILYARTICNAVYHPDEVVRLMECVALIDADYDEFIEVCKIKLNADPSQNHYLLAFLNGDFITDKE